MRGLRREVHCEAAVAVEEGKKLVALPWKAGINLGVFSPTGLDEIAALNNSKASPPPHLDDCRHL